MEVGATTVRRSDASPTPIEAETAPLDLLHRVAVDEPFVRLDGDRPELEPVAAVYAAVVEEALEGLATSAEDPIALAVPGWWPPNARSRVARALEARGVVAVLVNDAEAAVAQATAEGVRLPSTVAVLSLRSMQTSVVVVRDCRTRPTALLSPAPVLEEGGHLLDVAVLQHVLRGLDDLDEGIDREAPALVAAARDALTRCRAAREALSTSVAQSLHSEPFGTTRRIRLLRSELEELSSDWTDAVVGLVRTALEQTPDDVDTVLLTGGLASMPAVSQRLSADLGVEAIVPADPQRTAVHGAPLVLAALLRDARVPRWQRLARSVRTLGRAGARRDAGRRSSQDTTDSAQP
ncbi:Hsp70 family protein [Agrococcus versicolor]